jgi:hypothetical protein
MKKVLMLAIGIAMAAPIFAMQEDDIELAKLSPQQAVESNESDGVIVVPKRNADDKNCWANIICRLADNKDCDYNLHTGEIESLSLVSFAELINEAHAAGNVYLLARTESNNHTYCFDAKHLNALLKPNDLVNFRSSRSYDHPITRLPIENVYYYAIDQKDICTYKCSYNDFVKEKKYLAKCFVKEKKSLAEWNKLFPAPIVIAAPHVSERDLEAQHHQIDNPNLIDRVFYYPNGEVRRIRVAIYFISVALIIGGSVYLACTLNKCYAPSWITN